MVDLTLDVYDSIWSVIFSHTAERERSLPQSRDKKKTSAEHLLNVTEYLNSYRRNITDSHRTKILCTGTVSRGKDENTNIKNPDVAPPPNLPPQ